LSNVVAVAAGYGFGLALKSDGTVVKWGWDDYLPDVSVAAGLSNVVAIAAGSYDCLALKNDGRIVGWGDDTYGVGRDGP
jgi:alpha-tubulin suppressor-like RCC1 family protein